MSRGLIALLAATAMHAAILPENIGKWKKTDSGKLQLGDEAVWEEYGLEEAEAASYGSIKASAYRFKDTTGAVAGTQWVQSEKPHGTMLLLHENYLLVFEGGRVPKRQLPPLLAELPGVKEGPKPPLPGYFPVKGKVPYSERYLLGPAALAKFAPRIPPETVAFHLSAEGQLVSYEDGTTLAIFVYPTPNIARDRLSSFEKAPGAAAKRTGPLVAVVLSPDGSAVSPEGAKLLDQINYQARVSVSEALQPPPPQNVGEMLTGIFSLAGLLLVIFLLGGIMFAVIRLGSRRWRTGPTAEPEAMTRLNLDAGPPQA